MYATASRLGHENLDKDEVWQSVVDSEAEESL